MPHTHHRLAVQRELVDLFPRVVGVVYTCKANEGLPSHADITVCCYGQDGAVWLEERCQRFRHDWRERHERYDTSSRLPQAEAASDPS